MSSREESQWEEVWKLYDADRDMQLTKSELCGALRVLGRRYTQDKMDKIVKSIAGNSVDYETFAGILGDLYDGPTVDDLANALRAFDGKDCGSFTPQEITSMLCSMGDKLSDDEVSVVVDGLPVVNGKVTIPHLIQYFSPPVPSTKPNIPELMREIMKEELFKREVAAQEVHSEGGGSDDLDECPAPAANDVGEDEIDELLESEKFY